MKIKLLEELLAPISKDPRKTAERLADKFFTVLEIAEAEPHTISEAIGGDLQTSVYIKLAVALASRRICDSFKLGKKHTESEICDYLKALFFGLSVETAYMLSIDASGKLAASDKVGEGTVNFSNVLPRKLIEIAKRRKAKSVIIAHNHPGGYAHPSEDDLTATKLLTELFIASGIELDASYVVAGSECVRIN
jgi:DNA repair protein RadC